MKHKSNKKALLWEFSRHCAVLLFACACLGLAGVARSAASQRPKVLFIGNSFTAAMHSPAWRYRAFTVHDLNETGVGGVPALFKLFTKEVHLDYSVSVETVPGKTLKYHFLHKRAVLDQYWDDVVMQEHSTLNPEDPGNPSMFRTYADHLARMFARKNASVRVWLLATWSRPDLTYEKDSPWHGKSIDAMADDLQHATVDVAKSSPVINGVVPVGLAFNRAIAENVADADPYDGVSYGKINLWAYDNHHADAYGYYLEALMDFGKITGKDPRELGRTEKAAIELGLWPKQAVALQRIAYQQLHRPPMQ